MSQAASVSVAFVSSGGAGALTAGRLLLETASAAGWNGLLTRSVGPQIRGGEAAALLRIAIDPVECHSAHYDLLVGLDWLNAHRFAAEIPLGPGSVVLSDPQGAGLPDMVTAAGARVVGLPLMELATTNPAWRPNMIALGAAAQLLQLDLQLLEGVLERRFRKKGAAAVADSVAAVRAGADAVAGQRLAVEISRSRPATARRWLITGNEAVGLGAIRGGIRFAAAYPITPATEILEWLAANLPKVGGNLLQAEDELASVNMIIGSSYGGTPSLTATSGPGLSLMTEALGLAVASEVPIVVVDVMRGGPSTGIPTRSEQADLNMAIYGLHGDAPHLVVAPQSVADCVLTTQWAVHLAESLQAPALVLSDQLLGQAVAAIARPADVSFIGRRLTASVITTPYRRYAVTADGVSPMALPGTPGGQYTCESLTHTERGLPSTSDGDHRAQLDKRRDKLERHAFGDLWATLEGSGPQAVMTWGSLTGAAREAAALLRDAGHEVRLIAPRLLAPTRPGEMAAALDGVSRLLVVEQTHGAQFYRYLRAHYTLPADTVVLNRPGPLPIRPAEIGHAMRQWQAP